MHPLVLLLLLGSALAYPQGYSFPNPSNPLKPHGPSNDEPKGEVTGTYKAPTGNSGGETADNFNDESSQHNEGDEGSNDPTVDCPEGQVSHVDGTCVEPEVTRNIFVYDAPDSPVRDVPTPDVPIPKLNYNIVFVHTAEDDKNQAPIVVPPPQQKTLVYVLNKDSEDQGPQVIEVPAPQPHKPEVFYVNFKEGENPQLPIGIDLESALASVAAQQVQVVSGGSEEIVSSLADEGIEENEETDNGGSQGDLSFRDNQFKQTYQPPSNTYGSPRGNIFG